MTDASLMVGTTTADLSYHACRRDSPRSAFGRSRCGRRCHVTPRPWDDERQARQDSCIACVREVARIEAIAEAHRLAQGPRVHAYIRVSTDKQIEGPEVQEATIRTYCTRQGLPEPLLYSDPAISGEIPLPDREAGKRLLKNALRGDHVVVARLDRLSRNFLDFAYVVDRWAKGGVTLHPCDFTMQIRPDDPLSQAFVQMMGIFAAYERKLIATRTKEALAWRAALGRRTTSHPQWGFRWARRSDGHTYREEDEEESRYCIRAAELAMAGYTHFQIADYFTDEWGVVNPRQPTAGRWHHGGIYKLIARGLELMRERGLMPSADAPPPEEE